MKWEELFQKYYKTKDANLFQKILFLYEKYPIMIAQRLSIIYAFPYEELYQQGLMYLMEAIGRYNPNEYKFFSGFIYRDLNQRLKVFISENTHLIGQSKYVRSFVRKLSAIENSYDEKIPEYKLQELSKCAYIDIRIYYGLKVIVESLDNLGLTDFESLIDNNLEDDITDKILGEKLIKLVSQLKRRYQIAIIHRYGLFDNDCKDFNEISRILNTQSRNASQITRYAIKALKRKALKKGMISYIND